MIANPAKIQLPANTRTVLVGLPIVRAKFGRDTDSILAKVDSGELRWVFDVGLGSRRRFLRFWILELVSPQTTAALQPAQAIDGILGQGATIQRGEIERRWIISHPTIGRWIRHRHVELVAPGKVCRASLAKFLAGRWQGQALAGMVATKTQGVKAL